MITRVFNLSTEDEVVNIHDFEYSQDFIDGLKSKVLSLSVEARLGVQKVFNELRCALNPELVLILDSLFEEHSTDLFLQVESSLDIKEYPCLQVTPKTACVFIEGKVLNFNRFSGVCRGSEKHLRLSVNSIIKLVDIDVYKSSLNKEEFLSKYYKASFV